ncbi:unnamed protein product [Closterium sp. Naga37s-1]|nr:unnamed protein product [Closterium sp. Naga37s-1]
MYQVVTSYKFHSLLFFLADVLKELNLLNMKFQRRQVDATHVLPMVHNTTLLLRTRYLDSGDESFGQSGDALGLWLKNHASGEFREMLVAGTASDGTSTSHRHRLHEDPIDGQKSGVDNRACSELARGFVTTLIDRLDYRLKDLAMLDGAKLFKQGSYPKTQAKRERRLGQWLQSLRNMFKKKPEDSDTLPVAPRRHALDVAPSLPSRAQLRALPLLHLHRPRALPHALPRARLTSARLRMLVRASRVCACRTRPHALPHACRGLQCAFPRTYCEPGHAMSRPTARRVARVLRHTSRPVAPCLRTVSCSIAPCRALPVHCFMLCRALLRPPGPTVRPAAHPPAPCLAVPTRPVDGLDACLPSLLAPPAATPAEHLSPRLSRPPRMRPRLKVSLCHTVSVFFASTFGRPLSAAPVVPLLPRLWHAGSYCDSIRRGGRLTLMHGWSTASSTC